MTAPTAAETVKPAALSKAFAASKTKVAGRAGAKVPRPAAIPVARAAISDASGATAHRITPGRVMVELLMPVNVVVMGFILKLHLGTPYFALHLFTGIVVVHFSQFLLLAILFCESILFGACFTAWHVSDLIRQLRRRHQPSAERRARALRVGP